VSVRAPPISVIRALLQELIRFLTALSRLRVGPSIRISSWWRDPVTNRRVGGHPDSQHLLGLALDLVGEELELRQLLVDVRAVGLVAVMESTHLHVQLLPAGVARAIGLFARRSTFT